MPHKNDNIYLLLIDLKGSTGITAENSEAVYYLLEGLIESFNSKFKNDIIIPLQLSYGDEISGIFRNPLACYLCVDALYKKLRNIIGFRYCVSDGDITFPSNDMTKVGGTAFKRANRIMETRLKKRKWRFCEWALEDSVLSRAISSLANLCFQMKERMTNLQWDVYSELSNQKTVAQIAEETEHNLNSLYQVNTRSGSYVILEAETNIRELLSQYGNKYQKNYART